MKKHKFKIGDVGYVAYSEDLEWPTRILPFTIKTKFHNGSMGGSIKGVSYFSYFGKEEVYPTPEACAQALVEEFYINNPKT